MIWQLLQVGYIKDRPLILLGDMWHGLLEWMHREMVPRSLVFDRELEIPRVVVSIEDAVAIIKDAKERFDQTIHLNHDPVKP